MFSVSEVLRFIVTLWLFLRSKSTTSRCLPDVLLRMASAGTAKLLLLCDAELSESLDVLMGTCLLDLSSTSLEAAGLSSSC